jgi:O-antigen ligase
VVLLCLAGVLFLPDLAMHTRQDIVEQGLAGDWRGIFRHKNDLGPMAAHFVFVGLLLWRVESKVWGALVTGAALMLLAFSGAKSAAVLLAPALAAAAMVTRIKTPFWSGIVALSMVGGLLLVPVGSVMLPGLHAIIVGVLPDASFTGRSDVWELALNGIGQRPVAGYGYGIFWDTNLTYSVAAAGDTAALMSHSHNGYLETAISGGLPGLALVLAWAVILPLRHIATVKAQGLRPGEAALLGFFVAIWLFVLLLSAFEAVLFNRGDAIWFTGTLSISALALWARAPLAE